MSTRSLGFALLLGLLTLMGGHEVLAVVGPEHLVVAAIRARNRGYALSETAIADDDVVPVVDRDARGVERHAGRHENRA